MDGSDGFQNEDRTFLRAYSAAHYWKDDNTPCQIDQALIGLAEEISNSGVIPGPRQINGRYIQSRLFFRLQEFHEKLKEQIKGVENVTFRDVSLSWYGMAELRILRLC